MRDLILLNMLNKQKSPPKMEGLTISIQVITIFSQPQLLRMLQ